MEQVIIDADGKIALPPEVMHRHGLRAGDALEVGEAAGKFMLYQSGMDAEVKARLDQWWVGMTDEEKVEVRAEADAYWALSETERDAI